MSLSTEGRAPRPRPAGLDTESGGRAAAPLLSIEDLTIEHQTKTGVFRAVDQVSLTCGRSEAVGIVGESGSGKSSVALAATRLGSSGTGTVRILGHDVMNLGRRSMRRLRPEVQMIFQDPHGSLDPRQSVGSGLRELRRIWPDRVRFDRDEDLLARVRLDRAILRRYPHQLSGGQAQRVAIARALLLGPQLLVADEPTSGLDVSVQADVLALLAEIRRESDLAIVFISHDLRVVRAVCERVYVMQRGRIVESGPCESVFTAPREPYTRLLIDAMPGMGREVS